MLSITKNKDKEGSGWRFFGSSKGVVNPSSILEKLAESFGKELSFRLKQISSFSESLPVTEAIHLATDNLTNVRLSVDKTLRMRDLRTP